MSLLESPSGFRWHAAPGIWNWSLLLVTFPAGWQINIGRLSLVYYYREKEPK